MKSLLLLTLLASIPLFAAEEFAPWLPERRSVQKIQTLPPPVSRNTEVRSLDGLWKFSGLSTSDTPFREPDSPVANSDPGLDDSNWDSIKVPDSWFLKYPKQEKIPGRPYFKGWYRREFQLAPKDLDGKRVLLSFDAVAYDAKVFLNGKEIGIHRGDFTPFELDGTEAANAGRNVLAVRVLTDRGRAGGIPLLDHAYGSNWIMKGGIWQSVRLLLVPRIRVASILVTPFREQKRIEADYRIVNHTGKTEKIRLTARVTSAIAADKGKEIGSPDWMIAKAKQVYDRACHNFRRCLEENIPIAFGTDSGTPFNFHGKQTYEFQLMCENGMTPAQAITAATKTASQLMRKWDDIGSIEAGKFADVVAFDGDPMEDITAMTRCCFVMKGGEVYKA